MTEKFSKETYDALLKVALDPYKVFNNGKYTSVYAIHFMIKSMRERRISDVQLNVFVYMRDDYLRKEDYFDALCCAQIIEAWKREYPSYGSIYMGQMDAILRKYFKND